MSASGIFLNVQIVLYSLELIFECTEVNFFFPPVFDYFSFCSVLERAFCKSDLYCHVAQKTLSQFFNLNSGMSSWKGRLVPLIMVITLFLN